MSYKGPGCENLKLNAFIHQLNNMLTVIQGNAELIKLQAGYSEEVNEILITCRKCLDLLKQIRQQQN